MSSPATVAIVGKAGPTVSSLKDSALLGAPALPEVSITRAVTPFSPSAPRSSSKTVNSTSCGPAWVSVTIFGTANGAPFRRSSTLSPTAAWVSWGSVTLNTVLAASAAFIHASASARSPPTTATVGAPGGG